MSEALPLDQLRSQALGFVLRETGVTYVDLVSQRKPAELVAARALFVWIVKTSGPAFLGNPTIGKWLGGRDHSTIAHLHHNVVPRLRQLDPDFLQLCNRFAGDARADQAALLRTEARRTLARLESILTNLEAISCPQ